MEYLSVNLGDKVKLNLFKVSEEFHVKIHEDQTDNWEVDREF